MFDRLGDCREQVRARSVEDYEYFVTAVCGARTVSEVYRELWLCVVEGRRVELVPSETFRWIFPELVERRAAQRAA